MEQEQQQKKAVFLFFSFSLYAVYVLLNTRVYFHVQGCIKSTVESTNTNKEDLKKKQSETAPSCALHRFRGKQERKTETVKAEKEGKEKEKMVNNGTACSKRQKKEEPHILRSIMPEDKKEQPPLKEKEKEVVSCVHLKTPPHALVVASSCPWLNVIADF